MKKAALLLLLTVGMIIVLASSTNALDTSGASFCNNTASTDASRYNYLNYDGSIGDWVNKQNFIIQRNTTGNGFLQTLVTTSYGGGHFPFYDSKKYIAGDVGIIMMTYDIKYSDIATNNFQASLAADVNSYYDNSLSFWASPGAGVEGFRYRRQDAATYGVFLEPSMPNLNDVWFNFTFIYDYQNHDGDIYYYNNTQAQWQLIVDDTHYERGAPAFLDRYRIAGNLQTGGTWFQLDNIRVFNVSNGSFTCPSDAAPPPAPPPTQASQKPVITLNAPANNTINNTFTYNHTFNVSIDNGTIDICGLYVLNSTNDYSLRAVTPNPLGGNGTYGIYYSYTKDDDYEWNIYCERTVTYNSSWGLNGNFSLTVDTTSPTITINPNNFFTSINISTVNQYNNTLLPINITFADINLLAFSINITKNVTSYFDIANTSVNGETILNYTNIINPATFPEGTYNIELVVSDAHTSQLIKDYDISKFGNRITFNTEEGNEIKISSVGAYNTIYEKERDRYNFGFNYLLKDSARTFYVESNNDILYLPNSEYKAHFVILKNGIGGNWIDFEGIGDKYTVSKINNKKYSIVFTDLPEGKELILKSIGGLNIATENYQWYRGDNTTSFGSVATAESSQDFVLSLTKDLDFIESTNVTFIYNDISRTVFKTTIGTLDSYSSTVIVPQKEDTYNLSWAINITQIDSSDYQYSVNKSQQVFLATLNITLYDEENQTLIPEAGTFFLTLEQSRTETSATANIVLGNLTLGEYFIQAETDTYPRRGVFFTIANQTNILKLYLVKDMIGNDYVDYFIRDSANNDIEDARLTYQKSINGSFETTHQGETDFAGQQRFFQDQQNEYRIIIDAPNFPLKTISLFPLRTEYTIVLDTGNSTLYDNVYEGIRYTLAPQERILNISTGFTEVSIDIFDSASSLEYFGVIINNHTLECNPVSCITNISGIPAGGKAVVLIKGNVSSTADVHYFFKRAGFKVQYIHGDLLSWQNLELLFGKGVTGFMAKLSQTFQQPNGRHSPMLSIIAAILITVLCAVAAQFGVAGIPIVIIAILGNLFFTMFGFIPAPTGIIMTIVGIFAYVVLARD